MRSTLGRPKLLAALAAAALTAVALMLVPGAMGAKGKPAPPVKAPASADVLLYKGATTVALDAGAAGALDSLGISVAPSGNAYANSKGISFPISFGVVDSKSLAGQIRHSGGLKLTKGDTTVYLSRYFIDIDDTPSLSGLVGAANNTGDRADLFSLDLTELKVDAGKRYIKLSGVTLKLTADAADALNGAFGGGETPFAEGLVIGTATVAAHTYTKEV
jgi:hypothetical protein